MMRMISFENGQVVMRSEYIVSLNKYVPSATTYMTLPSILSEREG